MNFENPIILGSKSPRRRELLKLITSDFQAESIEVEESYPEHLRCDKVASYLAEKKASVYRKNYFDRIVITSDTTVILDSNILGKPESRQDGYDMLKSLSGRLHDVNTAVHISLGDKSVVLSEFTKVHFPKLDGTAINDYLERFNPMDKAGAYGIQECVLKARNLCSSNELSFLKPLMGKLSKIDQASPSFVISKIEGSYFNVMGLPIVAVAKALREFL